MVARGLVDAGPSIKATQEGVTALGDDFEPLPVGEELQDYWLDRLPDGEAKILRVLLKYHPSFVSRDKIREETEYQRSTRDAYLQRMNAKKLIVTNSGGVRSSEDLF